jgi:hypothetical protein
VPTAPEAEQAFWTKPFDNYPRVSVRKLEERPAKALKGVSAAGRSGATAKKNMGKSKKVLDLFK